MKQNYKSDIVMGEKYVDTQTGYEGTATIVTFFQHGCERVTLESYDAERKQIKEMTFDSPRLKSVKTGKVAETERTGGPDKSPDDVRRAGGRR
jgi:hypothetical protein